MYFAFSMYWLVIRFCLINLLILHVLNGKGDMPNV